MNFWKEFLITFGLILLILSAIFFIPAIGFVGIGMLFTTSNILGGIFVIILGIALEALCITIWLNL